MSSRVRVLGLYRRLLRLHQKLPSDLSTLGTAYVQSEFKIHRLVKDEMQIKEFMKEWESFEEIMIKQLSPTDYKRHGFGLHLERTIKDHLSEQQWGQLAELYYETKKFK
ncbi:PREDICTED: succinate dehydrogenase assembly factor 3, mitochondrial-like [Amphimedon queenslandica]|uniref:Succinate dehydrogenase assembly factor 3 n=1 Tax=Amphimedon queenslandica TaxID=400682 RepID=A0A1X7VC45_AMPQE|nr:PREDICTED: succinate dehydrogenase assembly factor 3, mitochondrial-like [Amphimedon queenslandica]|eukprot:XP_003384888.1 PREDICTED: succinate dehydrogenase assembly factor 3, mitochondrial-like [Amphimedon queenslandica]